MLQINIINKKVELFIDGDELVTKNKEKIKNFPLQMIKSIIINDKCTIATQVLAKCQQFGISFYLVNSKNKTIGNWQHQQPDHSWQLKLKQIQYILTETAKKEYCNWLLNKYKNQIKILEEFTTNKFKLEKYKIVIENEQLNFENNTFEKIINNEGMIGKKYYRQFNLCLPTEFKFKKRSKQPAIDMTNAFINYTYGILYRICEQALVKAGLDLYVGINHSNTRAQKSMLFDFIEIFRPWANSSVIHFINKNKQELTKYIKNDNEAYRIPLKIRRDISKYFFEDFKSIIRYNNRQMSRTNHIYLQASSLALLIKKS